MTLPIRPTGANETLPPIQHNDASVALTASPRNSLESVDIGEAAAENRALLTSRGSSMEHLVRNAFAGEADPPPFLSARSGTSAALLAGYTTLNMAIAAGQLANPVAMFQVLTNLTDYLPRMAGDALQKAGANQALELDRTMHTKIVGSAVVGALMLAAENYPQAMGLETNAKAVYVLTALGWGSLSALIVDVTSNVIRRLSEQKASAYTDPAPALQLESSQYICNADYIAHQAHALIRASLQGDAGQPAIAESFALQGSGNPMEDEWAARDQASHALMPGAHQRADSGQPFLSAASASSAGLAAGYAGITVARMGAHSSNPAAMLPLIHSLTGYMPRLIGDVIQKAGLDEAVILDKTMMTRIISTAVSGAIALAARNYPEAMGLDLDQQTAVLACALGWASLSSLVTEMAGNTVRRKIDGTSTVYARTDPGSHDESSAYVCSIDYIAHQAYRLMAE